MKPIVDVQHISKKFDINHLTLPYLTLRESLVNMFKPRMQKEEFWALDDVSFQVTRGESIGIIGKNGSGKSTLLKIISKITPPTKGKILIRGSVSSLLEVGTGFHPELTGLENIYLNGSILGMKRNEIKSKMKDIVDFAQVEKFLDMPLKRYSSGMQLRLAFSVSAFLEPDILIIDEVLAVGDSEFQKKCLKKMEEVNNGGRTIIFVSHNLEAVERICDKAVLLENGKLKHCGPAQETIAKHLNMDSFSNVLGSMGTYVFRPPDQDSFINKIDLLCDGKLADTFYTDCKLEIKMHFKSSTPLRYPVLKVAIYDHQDVPVLNISNRNYTGNLVSSPIKEGVLSLIFPSLPFLATIYRVDIQLADLDTVLDHKKNIILLRVKENHDHSSTEIIEELNYKSNKFFIKNLIWNAETTK